MTTIDPSKVKAGDTVTGTHEDFTAFGVARKGYTVTGEVYSGADGKLWVGHTTLSQLTLTDHQPAEPEWKPGTTGTATVRGVAGVRVMRTDGVTGSDVCWLSPTFVKGYRQHAREMVTDFAPDDTEAWQERYHEANRTVERLRAARTLPTDVEIIAAIWPGMDLVRHSPGQSHLGSATRVRALFDQGGAAPTCRHGQTAEELCNRLPDDRTLTAMRLLWDSLTPGAQRTWETRAEASADG